jgi:hypothetical protein
MTPVHTPNTVAVCIIVQDALTAELMGPFDGALRSADFPSPRAS